MPLPFLVATDQEKGLLVRIECEQDAYVPDTQLFHIGVAGHLDMVNERKPERGTVLTKNPDRCDDSLLLIVCQADKPRVVVRC